MKNVLKSIDTYQQNITEQKSISFSEKEFISLCDAFMNGLYSARKNGAIVGGLTVGMLAVGFKGYNMFKKFREKKYLVVLNADNHFTARSKEITVFIKAKDVEEAEKKVKDIINKEFNSEYTLDKIHEI
jgi:hypothetical protein